MKSICIIGLGNIGQTLHDIWSEQSSFTVDGCKKGSDVNQCIKNHDIIVLAVKPQSFAQLCSEIKEDISDKLVLSIMAGVSVGKIQEMTGAKRVVRTMPNLPLKVRKGFTAWFASEEVEEKEKLVVHALFSYIGEDLEINSEEKIDAVTALSGSGPAYFFFLHRCIREKAIEYGFSKDEARKIARATFFGAAKLLEEGCSDSSSADWIERITSPGGTTEAAIKIFEEKVKDGILEAIDQAFKRSKELGQ